MEDIFDKDKAYEIPFDIRLDAANALGQAGDPRLDRENRIHFPGGRFWIGAQKTDVGGVNFDPQVEDDFPVREVEVRAFAIGRYPVTVAEFVRFIEAEGYADARIWNAGEWKEFASPQKWAGQLEHLNRPVVGVSWYEASAYCTWVGGRLPTEIEWEYAARDGRAGVFYPWGNEAPDDHRANYSNNGSPGTPTPVGLYPAGMTPSRLHDIAGNVWEWSGDSSESEHKALRGGAWDGRPERLRVSSRLLTLPIFRGDAVGFRCVWTTSTPDSNTRTCVKANP